MSSRLLRSLILSIFAGFCLIQNVQTGDKGLDIVILKSGSIIEGEILESGEKDQITIISIDGTSYTIRIVDIAEIKRGYVDKKEVDSERCAVGSYLLALGTVSMVLGRRTTYHREQLSLTFLLRLRAISKTSVIYCKGFTANLLVLGRKHSAIN